ncbi:Vegetative protein 296 [bacterium HR23]|nr:Vegetative protein 296 [bacterium HR23]
MTTLSPLLQIEDLHVAVEGKEILRGVSLALYPGEVHALMGPNGSGKSTLAYAIMGHPKYQVTQGRILLKGEDITSATADERARKGLFLAFQYPVAVPGVTLFNLLRTAGRALRGQDLPVVQFRRRIREQANLLKMDESFLQRYVNEGFSGGEKKRAEILQLTVLQPTVAVLDETDSGLDIDALRVVAEGINAFASPANAILLITHYQRILRYVRPRFVHILAEGRIVRSGGPELAEELEARGYEQVLQQVRSQA